MLSFKKIYIVTFAFAFCLISCNLKPIYKQQTRGIDIEIINELARIHVIEEDGYTHHMLKNQLEDLLNPSHGRLEYRYNLSFEIKEDTNGSIISNDASIVSYTKRVEVKYRLYEISTSRVIDHGVVSAQNTFDADTSPFANYSSDKDATKRNILTVGDKIKIRVINKLMKRSRS